MKELNRLQRIVIDSACHFEYLYNFIQNVKEHYPEESEEKLRERALITIEILLKKKILEVYDVESNKKIGESVEENIRRISGMWFDEATYKDFIKMVYFSRQEWFYDKLKNTGYDFLSDWFEFVSQNLWLKEMLKIRNQDLSDSIVNKL